MDKIEKLKNLVRTNDKTFWRSLEEAADDPQVQDYLRHEFPQSGSFWDGKITRRSFLKLMSAQIMMLALAGCSKSVEKIIPYVKSQEGIIPGKPLYFATAISFSGFARGVLVESHMGRPTKIEGNPHHPDSLGATDCITQAVLYQLYDPDRSRGILFNNLPATWKQFTDALAARMPKLRARKGEGLRFLSKPIISPTLASLREQILQTFPSAKWHQYSPIHCDCSRQALFEMYGQDLQPVFRIKNADVIVSIESDFLAQGSGALAYSREFSQRRRIDSQNLKMNRLYALESTPTLTGAMADHRLIFSPIEMRIFLKSLWKLLQNDSPSQHNLLSKENQRRVEAMADDLAQHSKKSLLIAGAEQPVDIQIMVGQINHLLANVGQTIDYIASNEPASENGTESIRTLAKELHDQKVTDLFVIDSNPVYATPADLQFNEAYEKAEFRVHMGLYLDETAGLSQWHIPSAQELEAWGDLKAFDGTVTIRQPLIEPLYNGKTDYDLCALFVDRGNESSLEMIQRYWSEKNPRADFPDFWNKTLHDGVMEQSASPAISLPAPKLIKVNDDHPVGPEPFTLLIRPDPHILDGQFANNGWLQELPKPLTRLTWENVALISPTFAQSSNLTNGEVIEISKNNQKIQAPIWIFPGQANQVITIHLGYGRRAAGTIGNGLGFDAFKIQNSVSPFEIQGVAVKKTGTLIQLASSQQHSSMEGRDLVIAADLSTYQSQPDFVSRTVSPSPEKEETLYHPKEHLENEYQWGMAIDLNLCIGCNACTLACQVENNIPVVGKSEVINSREMHWIRVDRYYEGPVENPQTHHQPVPCMHCENAPCELMCPVEATTHSQEGLNEMTYNRCIGTRYCSNNCPYKVRRFNFYAYTQAEPDLIRLARNPDVTVRTRGVMEKCTYCVQRINHARIEAREENRKIRDGEVITACQQVCPAQAITFGNIRDPQSQVSKKKGHDLHYGILTDLGTRPRTTYLAKIKNPNPKMV